jgi:hypothetical protein
MSPRDRLPQPASGIEELRDGLYLQQTCQKSAAGQQEQLPSTCAFRWLAKLGALTSNLHWWAAQHFTEHTIHVTLIAEAGVECDRGA